MQTVAEEPLVSIVIPCYNSEQYLESTVDSVLRQTYRNWEALFIDDCSTDKSVEIIKKHMLLDHRIKLLRLKTNSGRPSIPRNIGIEKAKGKYIAFLDSDDIWHVRKLELQLKALREFSVDFVSTKMVDFVSEKSVDIFKNVSSENAACKKVTFRKLLYKDIIPTSSVLLDRKHLVLQKFDESVGYRAVEDYDLWLKIHREFNFSIKLGLPLTYYRQGYASISSSKFDHVFKVLKVLANTVDGKGKRIGASKYYYFFWYILYSIYYRIIKKGL